MPPTFLKDAFAAVVLAVAAVSAVRLAVARPWRRGWAGCDTDISYLLMGVAMAGMLASGLATLPDVVWAVVFGVLAVWFGYRVVRGVRANGIRALAGEHCAPHLAHCAAMLYMFRAVTAAGGMPGMAGMPGMGGSPDAGMTMLRYPVLAFAFALILIGYAVWDLDQLPGRAVDGADGSSRAAGALLSDRVTSGCRIAMGVAMALMLFLLI